MLDLRQRAIGVACVALFVLAPVVEAAPPTALIGPAQAIGERTITLTGSANANGGANARYFWNYGPLDTDTVLHTTMRPLGSSGPVDAVVPVAPSTRYWSQLVVASDDGVASDPLSPLDSRAVAAQVTLAAVPQGPSSELLVGFTHAGPALYGANATPGPALRDQYWAQVDALHESGRGIYRVDFTVGDPNAPALAETRDAIARGLPVLITLRQPPATCPWPAGNAFRELALTLLARFPQVGAYEIGNEPNYRLCHLSPQASADQYAALLTAVVPTLAEARKHVIFGSLGGASGSADASAYLVNVLSSPNLTAAAHDGLGSLSVHPYSGRAGANCDAGAGAADATATGKLPSINALGAFLARTAEIWSGDVWITEFDYRRGTPWRSASACPPAKVARRILGAADNGSPLFSYVRSLTRVKALIWYDALDQPNWFGGLIPPTADGYPAFAGGITLGTPGETPADNPYLAFLSSIDSTAPSLTWSLTPPPSETLPAGQLRRGDSFAFGGNGEAGPLTCQLDAEAAYQCGTDTVVTVGSGRHRLVVSSAGAGYAPVRLEWDWSVTAT